MVTMGETSPYLMTGLQGLFYVLLLCFTVQTIFLAYHWFAFGTSRTVSTTALAVYLCGGAIFFVTLASALYFA